MPAQLVANPGEYSNRGTSSSAASLEVAKEMFLGSVERDLAAARIRGKRTSSSTSAEHGHYLVALLLAFSDADEKAYSKDKVEEGLLHDRAMWQCSNVENRNGNANQNLKRWTQNRRIQKQKEIRAHMGKAVWRRHPSSARRLWVREHRAARQMESAGRSPPTLC